MSEPLSDDMVARSGLTWRQPLQDEDPGDQCTQGSRIQIDASSGFLDLQCKHIGHLEAGHTTVSQKVCTFGQCPDSTVALLAYAIISQGSFLRLSPTMLANVVVPACEASLAWWSTLLSHVIKSVPALDQKLIVQETRLPNFPTFSMVLLVLCLSPPAHSSPPSVTCAIHLPEICSSSFEAPSLLNLPSDPRCVSVFSFIHNPNRLAIFWHSRNPSRNDKNLCEDASIAFACCQGRARDYIHERNRVS